jgi:gluconolactonase
MNIFKKNLPLLVLIVLGSSGCEVESPIKKNSSTIDSTTTEFVDGTVFHEGIEGPAVDNNNLFVVNYLEKGTIGKVTSEGNVTTFVTLPSGSVGNGLRFYESRMYLADYEKQNIYCILKNGVSYVYATNKKMNQPNDLTMAKDGQIFCSDPNWGTSTGAIWTVSRKDSVLVQIKTGLGLTNGIELSPDDKYLYVGESKSVPKSLPAQVSRFKVNWYTNPVSLGEQEVLQVFESGDIDGMRCDQSGNLFMARPEQSEIIVMNSDGKIVHTVKTIGENPTNLAFGGEDGKTVYITVKDTKNIEQFRTIYPGRYLLVR